MSNTVCTQHEKFLLVLFIEELLFIRWLALGTAEGHDEERYALKLIADDLLAIKIHELGWPGPGSLRS